MGRIHVLSETVANQIAAGEVVERPASVVKEMLENSLDAGATRIKISVEAGGKKLIQITDNGCGMVRDDAMLAFERHATSKIKNAEDLLSVAHAGISRRGAALDRVSVAPAPGDASRGRTCGDGDRDQRRQDRARGRSRTAAGNFDHGARSLLQYSGAQEVLEGRVDRAVAHRVAGDALRAGASRQAFRIALGDQCHAGRASGRGIQRARLSGLRQRDAGSADSSRGAAGAGARWIAAASAVAAQTKKTKMASRCSERSRRDADSRLRLEARDSEAEPQFDFRLRQRTPDSRPPGAARVSPRLIATSFRPRCIPWCCFFWSCRRAKSM